ncbi:MAG: nucleotidyltransferase substrate binding protein [bacterium]|nr:nucleotidyltransferase substrate binding protein [bacterium]
MKNPDIRWHQRFENFDKAVANLREAVDMGVNTMSSLEKEGTVQRFEVAIELAWKTLKDYLESAGVLVEQTPRAVIKSAFSAGIVSNGQILIDMVALRNSLAHTYDEASFEAAVLLVADKYLPAIEELHTWLTNRKGSDA